MIQFRKIFTLFKCLTFGLVFTFPLLSVANAAPSTSMISATLIDEIRTHLSGDIVTLSIQNQNKKYAELSQIKIVELDNQWRAENKVENKPLISATLSSPLSSYLTRVQAHSQGLFTEIFVMDNKGLNVGQSNFTSDYWQGDEAKWQKTYLVGGDAVFIDEAEWNDEYKNWRAQVNVAIADPQTKEPIGAATFEINLTELARRN